MSETKPSGAGVPAPASTWMLLTGLVFDYRSAWHDMVSRELDLPFSRFRALIRLEPRPLTGRQLAAAMDVDAPAASVIITDLVERGLAVKTVDPDDARVKRVSLTDAGRAVLERLRAGSAPVALDAMLTDDERIQLHELVLKLWSAAR